MHESGREAGRSGWKQKAHDRPLAVRGDPWDLRSPRFT